jgi:type III secretory pathway lipoprotein EscJ
MNNVIRLLAAAILLLLLIAGACQRQAIASSIAPIEAGEMLAAGL